MSLGKFTTYLGAGVLLFGAWGGVTYRSHLVKIGPTLASTMPPLPLSVYLFSLFGLFLCVIGSSLWAASFQNIPVAQEFNERPMGTMNWKPGFLSFQHRGRNAQKK